MIRDCKTCDNKGKLCCSYCGELVNGNREGWKPIFNLRLTWRDVFDSQKIFPSSYEDCLRAAVNVNYKYIAFNGLVYRWDDVAMKYPICSIKEVL